MAFRYDSYNELVFDRIPPRTRVLDVGCATGRLIEALEQRKECICAGVEADAAAVEVARTRCSGPIEVLDLENEVAVTASKVLSARYGVVVFADVLEHLRDPARLLASITKLLEPGGLVVCSLPNIAFWRKRLMLLRGEWNYEEIGICDRTHVRFFTQGSARRLVTDAGLITERTTYAGLGGPYRVLKERFPRVFAAGFVIEARRGR